MKRRPAVHFQRFAGVMGEHEDRSVELRSLTPVALERILSPQALLVAEHPPAHHVGAGTFYRLREEFVVAISLAAFLTVHLAEAARSNSHSWNRSPSSPSGFSGSSFGPTMYPSSDIDMSTKTFVTLLASSVSTVRHEPYQTV
ncbi:hypothetical protein ACFFQF_21335 [Haladaptatus pallidirubidus]|uniref:hypothetical protein n=1 Tax=Haladaptatus pallidirubidus TaxID=1008152 RepID=UPI0035EE15A5